MYIKSYIAILLVTIFMVKFVAVDSQWLAVWFDGSEISFVNPHCKKDYPPKLLKDTTTPKMGQSVVQVINLNGYCTSLHQLEIHSWEAIDLEPVSVISPDSSSILSFPYLKSTFPPPRVI